MSNQYGNEDEKIRAFHRLNAARTEIRQYLSNDFDPDKELKEARAERPKDFLEVIEK